MLLARGGGVLLNWLLFLDCCEKGCPCLRSFFLFAKKSAQPEKCCLLLCVCVSVHVRLHVSGY
jgi:hypothetical protein